MQATTSHLLLQSSRVSDPEVQVPGVLSQQLGSHRGWELGVECRNALSHPSVVVVPLW